MADYKEMYLYMFRSITHIVEELAAVQRKAEEMYLQYEENGLLLEGAKDRQSLPGD